MALLYRNRYCLFYINGKGAGLSSHFPKWLGGLRDFARETHLLCYLCKIQKHKCTMFSVGLFSTREIHLKSSKFITQRPKLYLRQLICLYVNESQKYHYLICKPGKKVKEIQVESWNNLCTMGSILWKKFHIKFAFNEYNCEKFRKKYCNFPF